MSHTFVQSHSRHARVAAARWLSSRLSPAGCSPGRHLISQTHPEGPHREPARANPYRGRNSAAAATPAYCCKRPARSPEHRQHPPTRYTRRAKSASKPKRTDLPEPQPRPKRRRQDQPNHKIPIDSARGPRVPSSKTFVRLRRPKLFTEADGPLRIKNR